MSDRGPALSSLLGCQRRRRSQNKSWNPTEWCTTALSDTKEKNPSRRCARFPGKCILELSGEEEEGETSFLLCFHF